MTEELRANPETVKDPSDNGGYIEQRVGRYALPVSGLLITSGAVLTLVMAYKKVTTAVLWLIPVVMFWAGATLAVKPLQELRAKIERAQEEAVATLDQLDPVAKA